MNAAQFYQLALNGGVALAVVIAGGWFNKSKARGEGKQAEGQGNKSEAEGRTILDDAVWRRANEVIAAAESARDACTSSKVEMRREFAAFIDFWDDMTEFLPAEFRARSRERIRSARDALGG